MPCTTNAAFYGRRNSAFDFLFLFLSAFSQEKTTPKAKDNLEEIERLYLQFSFNTLASPTAVAGESAAAARTDGRFAAVLFLRNKLEQSLLCVADNLLNCYSPDVSGG